MNRRITSQELRTKYRSFFVGKGHAVIPSATLVPANDPSVLFTTAGMHPLVPYLIGQPHPAGKRLVDVQRCVRTGDIELIGDDTHLTFFEMLGNWSLADYGRDEAVRWSFEFLTDCLDLPIERLGVTCFTGDTETAELWRELGIPSERIQFLGREDNWWGPAGITGPCGPDTEIFHWSGDTPAPDTLDVGDRRWVEIWNNVFMSHTKTSNGTIEPLGLTNVDTGMGLERTLAAINALRSVYEVDTLAPIHDGLMRLAANAIEHDLRVLTDHLRAACFIACDGIAPSNKDRGYVLRRLLRRSLLCVRRLGLPEDWHRRAVPWVVDALGAEYPELGRDPSSLSSMIDEELQRFDRTLTHGLRMLESVPRLDGKAVFDLFQTYGFPFELTCELARASGKEVDQEGYRLEMERHRALSRSTSQGGTVGGLADHSDEVVRYHTLTHLLQSALRRVIGEHVIQRGSHLTRERLRFDFSHHRRLTPEEITRVEALVNQWVSRELVVEHTTMTEPEARALGAIGAFGEKYGETVSVYTIRDRSTGDVVSREFCGGPHTDFEAVAGRFQIVREQGIAAGIRRIKASWT
jgi:alanyl-tRNA synthetase